MTVRGFLGSVGVIAFLWYGVATSEDEKFSRPVEAVHTSPEVTGSGILMHASLLSDFQMARGTWGPDETGTIFLKSRAGQMGILNFDEQNDMEEFEVLELEPGCVKHVEADQPIEIPEDCIQKKQNLTWEQVGTFVLLRVNKEEYYRFHREVPYFVWVNFRTTVE